MRIAHSSSEKGTMLVATPGGHLDELRVLVEHLDLPTPHLWVTARTAHSVDVLAGCDVRWVPAVAPRDFRAAARSLPIARRLFGEFRAEMVVSTGAALAVPYMSVARAHRIPTHYVESATRFAGPSLSGALVQAVPGVQRYSQHSLWAHRRGWTDLGGSVFDAYRPTSSAPAATQIRNVVVTLGGEKFSFHRAVHALRPVLAQLPGEVHINWQLGTTPAPKGMQDVPSGPGVQHDFDYFLPAAQLRHLIADADLVIAHAGVGSVLTALAAGKVCVVLPRRVDHDEHIDNHQVQLADALAERDLVHAVEPAALRVDDLRTAAAGKVEPAEHVVWRLRD